MRSTRPSQSKAQRGLQLRRRPWLWPWLLQVGLAGLVGLVGLLGLVGTGPTGAYAADKWSTPYDGVKLLHRTTASPKWSIWVLVIDTTIAGVQLDATTSAQRKQKTSHQTSLNSCLMTALQV